MAKTLEEIILYRLNTKKTVEEVVAQMNEKQAAYQELAAIDNTSASSFFGQMKKMVAYLSSELSGLCIDQITDINSLIVNNRFGTTEWYKQLALSFQLGDNLTVIDGVAKYATIDETKQVVKKVNLFTDSDGLLRFYVWGANDTVLDSATVALINNYMNQVKIIGTQVSVFSIASVSIFINADVHKNSLLIDNNGKRIGENTYPIPILINEYLQQIPANQPFVKSWFEADILKNPEIISIDVQAIFVGTSGINYAENGGIVENVVGSFVIDPNSIFRYV